MPACTYMHYLLHAEPSCTFVLACSRLPTHHSSAVAALPQPEAPECAPQAWSPGGRDDGARAFKLSAMAEVALTGAMQLVKADVRTPPAHLKADRDIGLAAVVHQAGHLQQGRQAADGTWQILAVESSSRHAARAQWLHPKCPPVNIHGCHQLNAQSSPANPPGTGPGPVGRRCHAAQVVPPPSH